MKKLKTKILESRQVTRAGAGWWEAPDGHSYKLGNTDNHENWAIGYAKKHKIKKSDKEQSMSHELLKRGWIRVSDGDTMSTKFKTFDIDYYGADKLNKVEDVLLKSDIKGKKITIQDVQKWTSKVFTYDDLVANGMYLRKTLQNSATANESFIKKGVLPKMNTLKSIVEQIKNESDYKLAIKELITNRSMKYDTSDSDIFRALNYKLSRDTELHGNAAEGNFIVSWKYKNDEYSIAIDCTVDYVWTSKGTKDTHDTPGTAPEFTPKVKFGKGTISKNDSNEIPIPNSMLSQFEKWVEKIIDKYEYR